LEGGGLVAGEEVEVEGVVFVAVTVLAVEGLEGAGAGLVEGVAGFGEPRSEFSEAVLFELGDGAVAVGSDGGLERGARRPFRPRRATRRRSA